MSSFPPKRWEVRYLQDMATLEAARTENNSISMEALLAVRPAEGEEGSFRFALAGPEDLRLHFPVSQVLHAEAFKGMHVEAHLNVAEHIVLEKNSSCSKWADITDLVASQDVDIVDEQGETISERYLAAYEEHKKTAPVQQSGTGKQYKNMLANTLPLKPALHLKN